MHRLAVQRAYDWMHEDTRSAFMDLSSLCDGIGRGKTPRGIYNTNAFRLSNADRTGGLFLTIARMNHSCRPNVNHYRSLSLQMALVFASCNIAAGEELCTTYGPSEWMNTQGRREFLCKRFAFDCNCKMCVKGNDLGGDKRMEAIRSLQEAITLLSSLVVDGGAWSSKCGGDSTVAALESVERASTRGAFTKSIYHRGYAICDTAGDNAGARSYLVSELRAVRDSKGITVPM
ncbi:hypothetical protein ACHAW5_006813 [Stephanodiscus triporus]|uniref:SET domain-containing protein n=1 Tax=Stephanodiscus triporus TaxID=2934178 RepID=A0ABD3QQX6_9STRA